MKMKIITTFVLVSLILTSCNSQTVKNHRKTFSDAIEYSYNNNPESDGYLKVLFDADTMVWKIELSKDIYEDISHEYLVYFWENRRNLLSPKNRAKMMKNSNFSYFSVKMTTKNSTKNKSYTKRF